MGYNSNLILAITKICAMIVMFLVVVIVGLLPIRLDAFKSNKVLLAFGSAFSGGLFLSVGLLHLMPESLEFFEEGMEGGAETFPFAFLTATCSFAFVLLIEKVAVGHKHYHHYHH